MAWTCLRIILGGKIGYAMKSMLEGIGSGEEIREDSGHRRICFVTVLQVKCSKLGVQ